MTPDIRQLPAGNWKMNGPSASLAELMAVSNVDGALVGDAGLKAQDFLAIARARAQTAGH